MNVRFRCAFDLYAAVIPEVADEVLAKLSAVRKRAKAGQTVIVIKLDTVSHDTDHSQQQTLLAKAARSSLRCKALFRCGYADICFK